MSNCLKLGAVKNLDIILELFLLMNNGATLFYKVVGLTSLAIAV